MKQERCGQLSHEYPELCNNPYAVENGPQYFMRSESYLEEGDFKSAYQDLSKSIYLDPHYEAYIRRGKIYASESMFVYSLLDFQEAERIYLEQKCGQSGSDSTAKTKVDERSHREATEFIEKSIVVKRLPELKEIARKHEKTSKQLPAQLNDQFARLMNQMIEAKLSETARQEEQYQKLLQVIQKQDEKIRNLQANLANRPVDYEQIFYEEMEHTTLSLENKHKCMIYYHTVLSELEEYYLAAKVLHDIDEKKLKFEDYVPEQAPKGQQREGFTRFVEKMFKVFEKNSSNFERVAEIAKEIPYIGMAFKIIKSALKGFSWFEGIKIESECENIMAIRPNVSSFNSFASRLGYQMYKHFKVSITTERTAQYSTLYQHSKWEQLAKGYKNFKRKKIGANIYKELSQLDKNYINEMAQIHSSIFMVGVAYGVFSFPHGNNFPHPDKLEQIFNKMSQVEEQLLLSEAQMQMGLVKNSEQETIPGVDGATDKGKACALF